MAMESFGEALRVCRLEEGGNDDDPHDHGGRTSRGIIQREWDVDRVAPWMPGAGTLPSDVWKAPDAAIDEIYHHRFWLPDCDWMPAGLDLVFFLFNVNAGHVQATRELQRALRLNNVDGVLGPSTRQAAVDAPDVPILIREFCDRQRTFYEHLAQFPRYGKGWLARVDHAQAAGQNLAGLAHDLAPHAEAAAHRVNELADQPDVTVSARANPADLRQPVVTPEKAVATAGGAGAVAGVLQQLQDQLHGLSYTVKWAAVALSVVAALSIGLTLYGLWHQKKTREAV
jgi:lysozyme family protein